MTLAASTRLGPYEILSPIGAGGMGEVYRARDTRLGREVAIKVLPPNLSESPQARARLQREAKAISSLTHPHICTLHDVGHDGGVDYLVMELLEGHTLADRIERGPLPLEQALKYGVEIASALDRAHRAGIVHRDLKPGNVMLTKSGVKLLDFGLARLVEPEPEDGELSALPTEDARPLTEKGAVLGTFQYMAPEQLEGKDADARTDIFALGCVLYEMTTGRRAFSGATRASLVTSIMSKEPEPISTIAPMTPPALDRVVRNCIAKDPEDRWQSAHDVGSELQWIAQAGSQAGVPALVATRRKSRERLIWGAAVLAAAAVAAGIARRTARRPEGDLASVRFDVPCPAGEFSALALSSDGRTMAFVARDAGNSPRLWIRPLDAIEPRPVETGGAVGGVATLAWSPDGRFLVYESGEAIQRLEVASGTHQTVCSSPAVFGISWGASGDLVFTPFYGSGIWTAPASGGTAKAVTVVDRNAGEIAHLFPRFLPDGRRFLFFDRIKKGRAAHQGWVAAAAVGDPRVRRIVAADSLVSASEGYLLFTIAGTIYAQRFDAGALAVRGEPVALPGKPVVEGSIAYAFAETSGRNLAFRSDPPRLRRIAIVDRTGRELASIGAPEPYDRRVTISPDGRRALVTRKNPERGEDDLWMVDLERGTQARLGSGVEEEDAPAWSPDGTRALLAWDREGPYDLLVRTVDGSQPDEIVFRSAYDKIPQQWSPDGKLLLFEDSDAKDRGLAFLRFGSSVPALHVPGTERARTFALSPDGKWILSTSSEPGRREVYVQRFPEGSARQQVSVDGGAAARWSRDGREIFFVSPEPKLMAASFDAGGGAPRLSIPKPLFPLTRAQTEEAYPGSPAVTWDVFPDGQRFLILVPVTESDRSSITVVLNWTAPLRP